MSGRRAPTLALLSPSEEYGGAERYLKMLAIGALERGWGVRAAFPRCAGMHQLRTELETCGVPCHALQVRADRPGFRAAVTDMLRDAWVTWRLLRVLEPTATLVVLPHLNRAPGLLLGAAQGRGSRAACIQVAPPELAVTPLRRRLYTWVRSRGVKFVAVSQDNRARLAAALAWPPAELHLIYNGVQPRVPADRSDREVRGASVRHELRIPQTARLIAHVGRLTEQKGHRQLIDSARTVVAHRDDVWWICAGEGPLRAELEGKIEHDGLADRIRLLGARADVDRLLDAADLFVFPSLHEGFAFAVLEAHAAELPVIASDAGSLSEVVAHRVEGLLVPLGDGPALGDATLWALDHPSEMATMAAAARSRTLASFSRERMLEQTLALLDPTSD